MLVRKYKKWKHYVGLTHQCEQNSLFSSKDQTCDFYFNIQDCDEKETLLKASNLEVKALLVNKDNVIQVLKSATLSKDLTKELQALFAKQNRIQFLPGEYDANLDGLQATFEPAELARFAKVRFALK